MLGDEVVASAEILQLTREVFQSAVQLALVRLRGWFLITRVICGKGNGGGGEGRDKMVSMVTSWTALKTQQRLVCWKKVKRDPSLHSVLILLAIVRLENHHAGKRFSSGRSSSSFQAS